MTISQAHNQAVQLLMNNRYSREEAHVTVRILLDAMAGAPHAHLTHPHDTLDASQNARLEAALKELAAGRPLAYILGRREFFGLEFHCDERALIPRPETELLVEFALAELQRRARFEPQRPLRVADLGTGTGCVAVAIARNSPVAQVYATDVSPEALELARENARLHDVEERIRFLVGKRDDWAASLLDENEGALDVIVSNPPYISPGDIAGLPAQIREFEPRSALDGGPDGLDCYRLIARQCHVLLCPGGVIACELGIEQFEAVRSIFEGSGWKVAEPILDFQTIARVIVAQY